MLITTELARYITELSSELNRQIGVIISRKGVVVAAIVGDEREILIPDLSGNFPLGRRSLRGLRCVHTHLKDEALSEDDLTDLAILRLDYMAALGVGPGGLPANIHTAHLLPLNRDGESVEVSKSVPFQNFNLIMNDTIDALESEMGRAIVRDVSGNAERAILVSVSKRPIEEQLEALEELSELAATSDVAVLDTVCQRIVKLNPKYLMGSGKVKELIIKALQNEATLIIFNQDLTPTQVREIDAITELKVIDRTQLILDIFAGRAHSRDGKVQVELAQLKYLRPRLSGKGTSMSRLMGGVGGKGPGETKLEVDRRKIGDRISRLEKELKTLSRGRKERRRKRGESGIPIISIVGYTNAGKSSLLNQLTKSDTLVEDKLFATLDTATRRLRFPKEREVVITDTVGFIERLPKDLMMAFRATLEEMEDADLLLHLVDISSADFERRIKAVEDILTDIGLSAIPRLLVFNKIDLADPVEVANLCRRMDAVPVSATKPGSLGKLLESLEYMIWPV